MASPNSWPAGLAGTGFDLGTAVNDYFSGTVYWVEAPGGSDSNTGKERELPLATLAQAVTNASAGDLIVIEAGSAESVGTSQAISKAGLWILGLGQGSTRPRYTATSTIDLLSISAAGVRIFNLYFPASTAAATSRVKVDSSNAEIRGCYFECGANDTTTSVLYTTNANGSHIIDSTFAATAARPAIGFEVTGADDILIQNCTFDGGSYGWTDYSCKFTGASQRIYVNGMTLANRSDFGITLTGTTYKLFGVAVSGSGRVVITA